MDSNTNQEIEEEASHGNESTAAPVLPRIEENLIQIPSLHENQRKRGFFDFNKFRIPSPISVFRRTVSRREEISLAVLRRRLHIHFIKKINLFSLLTICKEWLSHPMHIALLLWMLCLMISGNMLGMLELGMLNDAFPVKELRDGWIEINNQIINALFTLMSIYKHPVLFHHLFSLCRWRSEDIIELRKVYCRNIAHRPNERAHMMVVILLFNITCVTQYALCGLNWGFTSYTRPQVLRYIFIALAITAPVCAGVYASYSPLGRHYESDSDEESHMNPRRILMHEPEWVGGLFDCFHDVPVASLSCCCTCCVFGWNMERIGFGNMYVHIATFILLCLSPLWIFNISAMKVHDYVMGDCLGIFGIVLSAFGLIYGGFWRIQMRKRFKLPENRFCCGSASLTDYLQWTFCWSCALAQEVRTGNLYDVEGNGLLGKPGVEDEKRQPLLSGFVNERGSSSALFVSFADNVKNPDPVVLQVCRTNLVFADARDEAVHSLEKVEDGCEEGLVIRVDEAMTPPVQPLMKVEDEGKESASMITRDAVDEPIPPLVKVEDAVIEALPYSST